MNDDLILGAKEIADQLVSAGFVAYYAGGVVRDRLLGKKPKDVDIVTSATPVQIKEIFPKSDEVGAHFGVMLVKGGKCWYDVATFRKDGEYEDGRHPNNVEFSSAEEDAQRRDFTVNGLFEDPGTGEIIDYVGGLHDLESKVIRAIGNPQLRFQEDALRLLRAVRFAVKLNFEIDLLTYQALKENAFLLEKVSVERILNEFSQIMASSGRAEGVRILTETGLMRYIIPEVYDLIGCEQPPQWHPEGDVYTHTMLMLEALDPSASLELSLATLLHDIAKPLVRHVDETGRARFNTHDSEGARLTREILRRLKASNAVIDDVSEMVHNHMKFMSVQQMRRSRLRMFMGRPTFLQELELHRVDCLSSNRFMDNYEFLQKALLEWKEEPILPPLYITGKDLIDSGIEPSPLFKEILNHMRDLQLEGNFSTQEEARLYLNNYLSTLNLF